MSSNQPIPITNDAQQFLLAQFRVELKRAIADIESVEGCPLPGDCRVQILLGCMGPKGFICDCGAEVIPEVSIKLRTESL